ncbi:hypothetical protein [Nonomuraea rubra]|uniref:hypothetical protein n=1 Tax=Nonomuraea rubra TaxID=46180 RepID=UPI00361AACD3
MWSQEVLALSRRWLLMTLRERLNLLFSVLQPAVWLVFFAGGLGGAVDARVVGTADYIAFAVPGVIAFTVVGNGVTAAMPCCSTRRPDTWTSCSACRSGAAR